MRTSASRVLLISLQAYIHFGSREGRDAGSSLGPNGTRDAEVVCRRHATPSEHHLLAATAHHEHASVKMGTLSQGAQHHRVRCRNSCASDTLTRRESESVYQGKGKGIKEGVVG